MSPRCTSNHAEKNELTRLSCDCRALRPGRPLASRRRRWVTACSRLGNWTCAPPERRADPLQPCFRLAEDDVELVQACAQLSRSQDPRLTRSRHFCALSLVLALPRPSSPNGLPVSPSGLTVPYARMSSLALCSRPHCRPPSQPPSFPRLGLFVQRTLFHSVALALARA